MKAIKFYIISLAAILLVAVPFALRAQSPATNRNQLVGEHCQSLASHIDQLQRRDLVSRTNLGREYETISKQFNAFNQRLRNNDMDAEPFEQVTTLFTDATNTFRAAYVRYDDSINKLMTIDCKSNPAAYDEQLAVCRSLRETTLGAAHRVRDLITQYKTLVQHLPVPNGQTPTNGATP